MKPDYVGLGKDIDRATAAIAALQQSDASLQSTDGEQTHLTAGQRPVGSVWRGGRVLPAGWEQRTVFDKLQAQYDTRGLKVGDAYGLINTQWYHKWCRAVGVDPLKPPAQQTPLPTPDPPTPAPHGAEPSDPVWSVGVMDNTSLLTAESAKKYQDLCAAAADEVNTEGTEAEAGKEGGVDAIKTQLPPTNGVVHDSGEYKLAGEDTHLPIRSDVVCPDEVEVVGWELYAALWAWYGTGAPGAKGGQGGPVLKRFVSKVEEDADPQVLLWPVCGVCRYVRRTGLQIACGYSGVLTS